MPMADEEEREWVWLEPEGGVVPGDAGWDCFEAEK